MKYLIPLILLSSCATTGRSVTIWSHPMDVTAHCVQGRIRNPQVIVYTNWQSGEQKLQASWECYIDENHKDVVSVDVGNNRE